MSIRRFVLKVLLGSAVGLVTLTAGLAQAEPPRLVSYGSFASQTPQPIGIAVDNSCTLHEPALTGSACTTFDPSAGDLYVAGLFDPSTFAPGHVNKFDAAGKLLSPPSPFGQAYHTGAAVNPVNGDVYALNALSSEIEVYDASSGALLSSFPVEASHNIFLGNFTMVQIATDSAGNVYVPVVPNNEVLEYSPSGTLLQTFSGSGAGALKEPTGVAVDSAGNVWVADSANNRIEELSPAGTFVGEIKSEGVRSVALDTHGDVFAIVDNNADSCGSLPPPCSHLMEYSLSGAQLADIGAGSFGVGGVFGIGSTSLEQQAFMPAVNDSSGHVYVSDSLKDLVWVFAPPSPPVVTNELAAEVSTTEAKLGALVDPGGIEATYRFEYLTAAEFQANGESFSGLDSATSVPFPEGNVGQGVTARTVWASANELAPGTTYHYRVVASNELGTVPGADQTFTTQTAAQAACPNEALRSGFSASLPDCRAYEMVTQPNSASVQPDSGDSGRKEWESIGGGFEGNHAARNGDRFSYRSVEVMLGADSSSYDYLATRGASGWSSEDVIPLQSYDGDRCAGGGLNGNVIEAYSSELTDGIVRVGASERYGDSGNTGGCGAEGLEVVQGEPLGVENLLLRDNATGGYELINVPPAGVTPTNANFQGASADMSRVFFSETAQLTTNGPAGVEGLYEWDKGTLRLASVLPDGTLVAGSLAAEWSSQPSVISADGSHLFFTAGGNLYVRIGGERTVKLDEAHGGSGPGGGGVFQGASTEGSQAFFTDDASAGLTSETVAGSGTNLYRYVNGQLNDLTAAEHAEVLRVLGMSEDGSYVYFVASGVLSGSQANQRGETAQGGQPNLYLWHGGTTTFIATLGGREFGSLLRAVAVSPNGAFLTFTSEVSLTGYDNTDTSTGFPAPEIFLYGAAANQTVCASCNPSGEAPSGPYPGGARAALGLTSPGRDLWNSGRLVFETEESLLPRDTNGQIDVYEYEQGQLHLISSGTSGNPSLLIDASEGGNDVFFLSHQSLVAQDSSTESNVIYDARVGGGFPAPASPLPCTTADACRTPVSPQPSIYGSPSSQTFSGVGNVPPSVEAKPRVKRKSKPVKCRKGFVKKKGKCVKRPKKARKSAHANKRTGK